MHNKLTPVSTGMLIDGIRITPVKAGHDLRIYIDADLSSVYADASTENGVMLLCRFPPTTSDLPICTYFHFPEAGSCPGAFPAGLRQRRVAGYSCPPNASTPVGSECSSMADLQSEMFRPHHQCTRQSSLAVSPGGTLRCLQKEMVTYRH